MLWKNGHNWLTAYKHSGNSVLSGIAQKFWVMCNVCLTGKGHSPIYFIILICPTYDTQDVNQSNVLYAQTYVTYSMKLNEVTPTAESETLQHLFLAWENEKFSVAWVNKWRQWGGVAGRGGRVWCGVGEWRGWLGGGVVRGGGGGGGRRGVKLNVGQSRGNSTVKWVRWFFLCVLFLVHLNASGVLSISRNQPLTSSCWTAPALSSDD